MPDGAPRLAVENTETQTPTPTPPHPTYPPTWLEQARERDAAAFAAAAKYPVREFSVLTPEQLAAARAQLGPGAPVVGKATPGDRRPLTAEQLRAARAALLRVTNSDGAG